MPAKSKQQQKFFGVVRAMQKGDIPKKGEAGEVADDMKKPDVKKMASTKHKGLPKKVKEIIVQELVKELKLNEVKPFIDPKLKSGPHDEVQYVATNDHRYPSEIVFIDTKKGHVVFFNIQRKEVERVSWHKLNSTHWVRPYLEKEFEGFLDGWSPSGKIQYEPKGFSKNVPSPGDGYKLGGRTWEGNYAWKQTFPIVDPSKIGNKINIARAKAHFKQGEKIAAINKKTKKAIRISHIDQLNKLSSSTHEFAYITESKLNEGTITIGTKDGNLHHYPNFKKSDVISFLTKNKMKQVSSKKDLKTNMDFYMVEGKLNEAPVDMNDPFLVQTRIMRHAAKERKALDVILKAQPKVRQYKISFDKYLELLDQQMFFQQDLADIGKQIKQMWIDMEQEAEPEGGPIADRYGRDLMKLEADYKKVKAKLAKVDARVDRHSRY